MATIVFASCVLLLAGLAGLSTGAAIMRAPLVRRRATNLVAVLPSGAESPERATPRLWLVAHLDSKSQPISILARGAAVTLCIVTGVAVVLLLALQAFVATVPYVVWVVVSATGALSAFPILLSVVRNDSNGALDNASGVVAVMMAAARLSQDGEKGVGVLLTSAEEFCLAGAHAWCRGREPGIALNVDTVDDSGQLLCLGGRRRGGRLLEALRGASREIETGLLERRTLSGILVDSMAFEAAGWDSATICRGTLRSLTRVHTRQDIAGACSGAGSILAADVLCRACRILLKGGR
jgi:hypothetical protein